MPGPTRFAEQHAIIEAPQVDDETFRPFWRVIRPRTRLDRLHADGAITDVQYQAARRFRQAVDARLQIDAKTARRWTIIALQALALVEAS